MKTIITLLSILILFSCNEPIKVEETKTETQKFTKFETFLLDFKKQHPKWDNNQKTIKETSILFKKGLIDYLRNDDSVFYFHILKLERVFGGKYGRFRKWEGKIKEEGHEENLWYVDVVMEIQKTQIDDLVEGKYYRVIGKFKRYIKENNDEFEYEIKRSWTYEPEISRSEITHDFEFNIGCIILTPIKID